MSHKPASESTSHDEWFSRLFGDRPSFSSEKHPSLDVLKNYLDNRLPQEDKRLLFDPARTDWTVNKVSFHLLDCDRCSEQLAQLRRVEVICHRGLVPSWWQQFSEKILHPRTVKAHLKTFAVVAVILLLVNAGILLWNSFTPPVPPGSLPPSPSGSGTAPAASSPLQPIVDTRSSDIGGGGEGALVRTPPPPEPRVPVVPTVPFVIPPTVWWTVGILFLWGALWLMHLMTQTQQRRLRQALQRVFSPQPVEHRLEASALIATTHMNAWVSFAR
jgi:hypothetical protein